jgi:hypothetical protein
MRDDRSEFDDEVAAGSTCPTPDCGALALVFAPQTTRGSHAELWEFTCPRCGNDFVVTADNLIFQSVPKKRLLAQVQTA